MEAGGGRRPDHHVRGHHRPLHLHQLEEAAVPLLQRAQRQKVVRRGEEEREPGAVPAIGRHQVRDHRRERKEGGLLENKEQAELQENELRRGSERKLSVEDGFEGERRKRCQ